MTVLAVFSNKGGVGKTTTAVCLSYLASRDGLRTLLWDLDPQGGSTYCFRIRPKLKGGGKRLVRKPAAVLGRVRATDYPELDLLPADRSLRKLDLTLAATKKPELGLKRAIAPLRKRYDLIVLDCAPGLSPTADSIFRLADTLLVPVPPSRLARRALVAMEKRVRRQGKRAPKVLPFFNMVDGRLRSHREQVAARPKRFLEVTIPLASIAERVATEREPIQLLAPRSKLAREYRALWAAVRPRIR